jgi:hypothetical protein
MDLWGTKMAAVYVQCVHKNTYSKELIFVTVGLASLKFAGTAIWKLSGRSWHCRPGTEFLLWRPQGLLLGSVAKWSGVEFTPTLSELISSLTLNRW